MDISTPKLRLFFIYSSFFTLGGSFLVYLMLAFGLKMKDLVFYRRPGVFDL